MTAYPKKGDIITAESFEEQKKLWFGCENKAAGKAAIMSDVKRLLGQFEWAVELDTPWIYEEYLSTDFEVFADNYWKRNHLSGHCFFPYPATAALYWKYFCHLLFPKKISCFCFLKKPVKMVYR